VGVYHNGVRAKGTLSWKKANNQEFKYVGTFNENNQFQGKGMLKEPTGEYEGEFVNG